MCNPKLIHTLKKRNFKYETYHLYCLNDTIIDKLGTNYIKKWYDI